MLRERMAADWVDLEGFLMADDPSGPGLIGSCWTKVHRDHAPVLGEIYVISVDPRHHGQGWGRSLTVAGLESLARRGVPVGMLYVDATNQAAVGLYRVLGFEVDHVDRSYRRDPALSGDDQLRPRADGPAHPVGHRRRHGRHGQLAQRGDDGRPLGEAGQDHAHGQGGQPAEHHREHDRQGARGEEPGSERNEGTEGEGHEGGGSRLPGRPQVLRRDAELLTRRASRGRGRDPA